MTRTQWGFVFLGIPLAFACSASSGGDPNANGSSGGATGIIVPGGGASGFVNWGGAGGETILVASGGAPPNAGGAPVGAGGSPIVLPPPVDAPVVINECPGSLDAGTVTQLQGGGSASGSRLVYPYDGTIFPVGLLPPVLMWDPPASDAVLVHMKSEMFEYTGCFPGGQNLPIPANAWNTAGVQSKGAVDPLTLEVTIRNGGSVVGPITQKIIFARGKLKGAVYYNTYTSPQAADNGAVMRLPLGNPAPDVLLNLPPVIPASIIPTGPCWSCHSLSADGTMLVAQRHSYPAPRDPAYTNGELFSGSFDMRATPNPNPTAPLTRINSGVGEMGFGAVFPDGSRVLTMGSPGDSGLNVLFPDAPGNIPAMIGPKPSVLLDTRTGGQMPINGWTVQFAKMPSFSPDGTKLVFNWHEDSNGHSLAIADFSVATNTFSNVRQIYKHDTLYPGWPFITPDNQEVVFVLGNAADYVSGYPSRPVPAQSSLWSVNVATGRARPLSRANGYLTEGGPTYLPRAGRDEKLDYFPTMSPIAAGGYFWVFFTSRRTYGTVITQDAIAPVTKKIWVSAFNIMPTGEMMEDPSNPPFYLPGQEEAAGNIRAFAALEPCRPDGGPCETGVDCCGHSCYMGTCGPPPPPPPPPPGEPPPPPPCSKIDEGCTANADCCDVAQRARCIAGFCNTPEPR